MHKLFSLVRASMTDKMELFRLPHKNDKSKAILPIFIAVILFFSVWSYANIFMEPLAKVHMEFVLLTLFVIYTSIMTLIEGIYKSSSLLFNCKDDDLLFSLPIRKSTVLFIRILKFYLFELMYNTLFLLPAIVVYKSAIKVGITYYISSFFACLLLPIIPIIISCIIGMIVSYYSSKFKLKNIAQTLLAMVFLLFVFYISFNLQGIVSDIAKKATSINNFLTRLYYPAGAYIKLVTDFHIGDLLLFIIINIAIFTIGIYLLSTFYFKINSNVKSVKTSSSNKNYQIKTSKPVLSLMKKELNKFISTPVFIINAAFGLLLYVVGSIIIVIKFNSIINSIEISQLQLPDISNYYASIIFILLAVSALMTSISSSMISLEGKHFIVLKSLPLKPSTIIVSKVLTAVSIMYPFLLIGDIILFIGFKIKIIEMFLLLLLTIVLPIVSESIGIIINLKYPKMDAESDTEVVKQSLSSMLSVFIGMALLLLTCYLIIKGITNNYSSIMIMIIGLIVYTIICTLLLVYIRNHGEKDFNNIKI